MIYDIAFDRIGRHRDVPPLEVDVPAKDEWYAADYLAGKIHTYASRRLASAGFEVVVDLAKGTGYIMTGQPAGDFTVTARAAEGATS